MRDGTVELVVLAGSLRRGSCNRLLAGEAARLAEERGAGVLRLDLRDYPMPVYDAGLEEESGLPPAAVELKRIFAERDGFVLASPEYNGSLPPLLKNTLDWMSRPGGDPRPMLPYRGKVAGLLAASPGRLGGIRMLPELRRVLSGLGVHVVPAQFALHGADRAFDGSGRLVEAAQARGVDGVVAQTLRTAAGLGAGESAPG